MKASHFPTKSATILHLPEPKVLPPPEHADWSLGYRPPLLPSPSHTGTESSSQSITFILSPTLCRPNVSALAPRLWTQLQPLHLVSKTPPSWSQPVPAIRFSTTHGSSALPGRRPPGLQCESCAFLPEGS